MSDTDFDMARLTELRTKAENGELTEEEREEVYAMHGDFMEAMQPAMEGIANAYATAAESMADALQPLTEEPSLFGDSEHDHS